MDNIDLEIIKRLQADGRIPFTDIAKELGISEGTVRNRTARLIEDNTIQIIGMIEPTKLGFDAPAIIGLSVRPAMIESVATTVANFPEVSYLIMVSGEFDLFVEVLCRNRDELATFLNEKLLRVPGISRSQSFVILRTYKMAYGARPAIPKKSSDKQT